MATENQVGEPAAASPETNRSEPTGVVPEREWARKRIEKKRKLRSDIAAYVVINAFLIGVWAVTGLGYFWPGWVLAGWGVLLVLDAWNLHDRLPVTEDDIDRELRNRR
jgi:hypothetical protein